MDLLKNSFKKNAIEIFESLPDLYLILDKKFDVVVASNSYLQTVFNERKNIIGCSIFEIFDESNNQDDLFITELRSSLNRVLVNKESDPMIMHKYNIYISLNAQKVDIRYWFYFNTPVLDNHGEVLFIIHKVIDLTVFFKKKKLSAKMHTEVYQYITFLEEANHKLHSLDTTRMAMIEAIPDAMLVVNREGVITYVNHRLEFIFGYAQDELIGKKIELLIPEPYRTKHPLHRENYFKNPRIRPMGAGRALVGQQKDGSIISVEISLSPLTTIEGQFAIAIIRDTSL